MPGDASVSSASPVASEPSPVLALQGVSKRFAGVQALRDVSLRLFPGEVHALMGENGAGKSTLIKVITGVHTPDAGQVTLGGTPIAPKSPLQARAMGISTVYQEVNLCSNLTVAENIFAGRYPRTGWRRGRRIDWAAMNEAARGRLARLNLSVDVTQLLGTYPVAVQQMVAIARALDVASARVLILDEPTSSLDDEEVQRLFEVLRRLRAEGMAILFVTHFIEQVYALADRITVLRNGTFVCEKPVAELPAGAMVAAMVGRELDMHRERPAGAAVRPEQAPVVELRGFGRKGVLQPTALSLHAGEVLGLAGLLGSGRTELAHLLFGLVASDAGELLMNGKAVKITRPSDAIREGMALPREPNQSAER